MPDPMRHITEGNHSMNMTRADLLDAAYRHTHRDFKGEMDGVRTIMVYRNGLCLVALDNLTDDEIAARLPKNLKGRRILA